MSFDLYVAPGTNSVPLVTTIFKRMAILGSGGEDQTKLPAPWLIKLPEGSKADRDELRIGDTYGVVGQHGPTSLVLHVHEGSGATPGENVGVEYDYITDYGANLSEGDRDSILRSWQAAGYFFSLSSGLPRSASDFRLLGSLSVVLAEVTDGVVIVPDPVFSIPVGVYKPDVISQRHFHPRLA